MGQISGLLMPDMYGAFQQGAQDGRAELQRKTLAQYVQPAIGGDQGALAKIYGVDPDAGMKIQQNAQQQAQAKGQLADQDLERLGKHSRMITTLADAGDMSGAQSLYDTIYPEAASKLGANLPKQLSPEILQHMKGLADATDPQKPNLVKGAPGDVFMDQVTGKPAFTVPGDKAPPQSIQELQYLQSHPDLMGVKERLAAAGRAPVAANALQQRIATARQMGANDDQIRSMVLGSSAGDAPATQLGDGSKTGADYLASIPDTGLQQQIQAIAEGRMPLPKVSRPGRGGQISPQDIQKAVAQYDPTYDQGDPASRLKARSYFTTGDGSKQSRSLNTLIGHLAGLAEASDALDNGSSTYLNAAENTVGKAFGSTKATNFDSAAGPVASEFATLLKGGVPAEGEIEAQKALLNSSRAPKQLKGTIGTMAAQALSRLDALEKQKSQALGPFASKVQVISPEGRAALEKLRKAGLIGSFDLAEPDNATTSKTAPSGNGWAIQKVSQ